MDAIAVIAVMLLLTGTFYVAGLTWWVWFWLSIAAVLGIFEGLSYWKTGKTISQQFWAWRKNPATPVWQKWAIGGAMVIFWTYLILHLFVSC